MGVSVSRSSGDGDLSIAPSTGMGVSVSPPEHGVVDGDPQWGLSYVSPPPRKLRCLDVGGLAVQSPGLLRILLEEMLPQCRVLGMEMEEGDPPEAPPELGQPPPPL